MAAKPPTKRGDVTWRDYLPRVNATKGGYSGEPWYRLKAASMRAASDHMAAGLREYARRAGFNKRRMAYHMDISTGVLNMILRLFPDVRMLLHDSREHRAWTAEDERKVLNGEKI